MTPFLHSKGRAMNESANVIFRAIIAAAAEGRVCPSNARLGLITGRSEIAAARTVKRLQLNGYIEIIKIGPSSRVVRIPFTGQKTAAPINTASISAHATVLRILTEAAAAGKPTPSDYSLAVETGKGDSSVARIFRNLQKSGDIVVERIDRCTRRVQIVSTGQWTAGRVGYTTSPPVEKPAATPPKPVPPSILADSGFIRPITKAMLMARR